MSRPHLEVPRLFDPIMKKNVGALLALALCAVLAACGSEDAVVVGGAADTGLESDTALQDTSVADLGGSDTAVKPDATADTASDAATDAGGDLDTAGGDAADDTAQPDDTAGDADTTDAGGDTEPSCPEAKPCDDGNPCTQGDSCKGGICN
ncbi:MAG: hypothetical protein HY902_20240, partial [Deltaproteobacteria bacterium]|nr:hypothetical protein [Deltaproteobacteria bacterium]